MDAASHTTGHLAIRLSAVPVREVVAQGNGVTMVMSEGNSMSDGTSEVHLNNHHRDTLMSIFQHPVSHNIDWKAVISLLDVVGTVNETSDGKFHVVLGDDEIVLLKPRHKDIDVQTVVDLRRLLAALGYGDQVHKATNEGKEV